MAWNDQYTQALINTAQARGIDPVDLATVISYETGGTFDPWQRGPTTQWGQHRGLIQMGEPQRAQYGYAQDGTPAQQMEAVGRYLDGSGFKPGMGLLDLYSTINAGAPGRYNRSDAGNGGAWGTVADKVRHQFGAHRAKAEALLGGGGGQVDPDAPAPNAVPAAASGGSSGFFIPPGAGSSSQAAYRPGQVVSPPGFGAAAPVDESYKTDITRGGPAALWGLGREDYSLADGMIGAGTALMAMSGNAQGAAALSGMLKHTAKGEKKAANSWKIQNFNPETGMGLYINEDTGQVQQRQFGAPYRTMSSSERNTFDESHDNIGINSNIISQSDKWQKMIADGKVDLSLAARSKDFLNSSLDQSDEVGRNTQAFLQWRNGLANDLLRLNKGTQTDRDYANTLKELAPGLSNYDNRATFTALDAISEKARNQLGRQIQRQTSIMDEYGDNAPRGTYRQDYGALGPRYEQAARDFAEQRQRYLSRKDPASAAQAVEPAPRAQPNRGGSGDLSPRARSIFDAARSGR